MPREQGDIGRRRARAASALICFAFGLIFLRSLQIMVIDRGRFQDLKGLLVGRPTGPCVRPGDIYDRRHDPIATSIALSWVCAMPRVIPDAERPRIARVLAAQLDQEQEYLLRRLSLSKSYVVLVKNVEPPEARAVRGLQLPGILVERGYARRYPLGEIFGPLIGFREKSIALTGLSGLEDELDPILIGTPGRSPSAPWPLTPVGLSAAPAVAAGEPRNVVLTVDSRIQTTAFSIMSEHMKKCGAKAASCTIMDPVTGELLSVVSLPSFDPNSFEEWATDEEQYRFQTIPASYAFEPGSMCKPLILAAALESGKVDVEQRFTCTGTRRVGGWTIGCWSKYRSQGHGTLTPITGLVHSCNLTYAQISTAVGASELRGWLQEFGLGRSTGSECHGEAPGRIPSVDSIGPTRLATMGYGQSLTVTGLQMVAAVGAIANEGILMRPHLTSAIETLDGTVVERVEPEVVRQAISERTAKIVLDAMERVVLEGTGRRAAIPGVRVCGKTGTAQKVEDGVYVPNRYICSFVGVAGVGTKRPIVVLVWFDEPAKGATGGWVAAPAFKEVAEATLRHLGVLPEQVGSGRAAAA